jgi:hypothetical protein
LGQIYLVDGSIFPVVQGMTWLTGSIESSLKLHLFVDLNKMIAVDCSIGLEGSSEREALRQKLTADHTYVVDRGYFSYQLFHAVLKAKAHLVVRTYSNIVVETVKDLPVVLPQHVSSLWTNVRDRIVTSPHPDANGLILRLIEFSVGETEYKLMTDRLDLSTFQVILLYAYRWQIELMLKFFKHTLNVIEVFPTSPKGIENFFLALFLTTVLHLHFKSQCLAAENILPPTPRDGAPESTLVQSTPSPSSSRPTAHLAIAYFMSAVNHQLALFWKIPKHWLLTLADHLYRPFSPHIVSLLNQHALRALPAHFIP